MSFRFKLVFLSAILAFSFACKKESTEESSTTDKTQQLYTNASIYTVSEDMPWADAMLIENGIIIAIGTEEDVRSIAESDAVESDMENRMMMPGIHDVHMHPLEASSDNFLFLLNENEWNAENYTNDIQAALIENPYAEWILGWGFDIFTILDASRPPVEILDDISIERPIMIMEKTSHSIWCNSKALELAGITSSSPNPTGGVIMKTSNGNPNGILIDNAGNLMVDLAIASIPNSEQNDYDGLLQYGLPQLAQNGITSACDARTYWKRNHHKTWQKIEDAGLLTARISLGLWAYPEANDADQINSLQSLYSNEASSLLKINQIKLYSDGIVINTTSAMQDNFLLDFFDLPTNNGLNYFTESRIAQYIAALESSGFDFHIHTIGNRGVKEALNAIQQSGTNQGRHRLTHVEFVDPTDYTRFAQLNVTADCQVAGDFTNPENWSENAEFVGTALSNNIIPIKNLQESNARITLSSDWDVSTLNPFIGIQHAVSRAPQEISLADAIKAYTINAAYVMRQENKVGSLELGKEADFIVLDKNLFEITNDEIGLTKVLKTYLQGKLIYSN